MNRVRHIVSTGCSRVPILFVVSVACTRHVLASSVVCSKTRSFLITHSLRFLFGCTLCMNPIGHTVSMCCSRVPILFVCLLRALDACIPWGPHGGARRFDEMLSSTPSLRCDCLMHSIWYRIVCGPLPRKNCYCSSTHSLRMFI